MTKKKLENVIRNRLRATKNCDFKKAFIPTDWAIVKIDVLAEELANEILEILKKEAEK